MLIIAGETGNLDLRVDRLSLFNLCNLLLMRMGLIFAAIE